MHPLPKSALIVLFSSMLLAQEAPDPASGPKTPQGSNPAAQRHTDTVVVTGTPAPLPLGEADRSVAAYPVPDRILLFGTLSNVLNLDSSVDLEQRAPGVQGDISIRGGTVGQTLVLMNGIRVNDAQSAHHNFDIPAPLDAISQLEVLRGSGSTLYGSDAVGGVVNILTRVAPENEFRFRSGIGSFGTNTESGYLAVHTGALSQQFSFERELSSGFRDDREYRNLAGSYEADLRTRLGTSRVFLSGLDRPFGADQFYGNFNSWERTKTWFASLHQDLGSKTDFSFAYRRHSDLYVLLRDDPAYYTNNHVDDSWYASLRRHDELSNTATVFYGADGLADSVDSTNLGVHHRQRGAAYADLDVRALKRFSFSAGVREEVYGGGQAFFAPSLGGGYWLTGKLKLRASLNRAFRLPNYTDLYYHDPATLGNPNLKPEQALDYEGGVDFHPNSRILISGTVFERRETNDIDYVRASPADLWHAMNFEKLHFTGVELNAEARLAHSQQLTLQYTGLHGAQGALGGLQSEYLFNYPQENLVAGWQILTPRGILARTRLGFTNRIQRPAYALWDVNLAWVAHRIRPYLQLTNLTNTGYQEVVNVAMPGRAALAGIEICITCKQR